MSLPWGEKRNMAFTLNLGFGRANNLARQLTNTPLVLFLNPDTELREDTLERTIRCFDGLPDVGAVGCRTLYPDGTLQELGLQWTTTVWTELFELLFITGGSRKYFRRWLPTIDPYNSAYVQKLYGAFLMVRRDVLEAAGWFDERYFMFVEDVDLSRTILSLGWKLYYCSEAAMFHLGGGATAGAPNSFSVLMKEESVHKLIEKYQGSTAAALHRAVVLFGGLLRLSAVLLVRSVSMLRTNGTSGTRWKASCVKQQQLVLWSLGLRKATVPLSPPGSTGRVAMC